MLAKVANQLEMNNHLLLSHGESKDNGRARNYIMANALEALIGAIYLDQGHDKSKEFIEREIIKELPEIIEQKLYQDPKSQFQEEAQERVGITPAYKVMKEWGPDHDKQFIIGIYLEEELIAESQGSSKQEAQERAAKAALKKKKWN